MMAVLVCALVVLDVRILRDSVDLNEALGLLWRGVVVGIVVAVIEELWFRGGLYSVLQDIGASGADTGGGLRGGYRALALTSLLYAAVHFVRPDAAFSGSVQWWSGLWVIGESFDRFANPDIIDSFLALVAAGWVLGLTRQRTDSIAACIGLHAGWVSVIYPARKLTVLASTPSALVGTYDGVVGWLATVMFALCAGWLIFQKMVPRPHE